MKRPTIGHPCFRLWRAVQCLQSARSNKLAADACGAIQTWDFYRSEAAMDLRHAREWLGLWIAS